MPQVLLCRGCRPSGAQLYREKGKFSPSHPHSCKSVSCILERRDLGSQVLLRCLKWLPQSLWVISSILCPTTAPRAREDGMGWDGIQIHNLLCVTVQKHGEKWHFWLTEGRSLGDSAARAGTNWYFRRLSHQCTWESGWDLGTEKWNLPPS